MRRVGQLIVMAAVALVVFVIVAGRPKAPPHVPEALGSHSSGSKVSRNSGHVDGWQGAMVGYRQPAPSPSHGQVSPRGVDATCRTDVTAAILAWIDRVPDGSTIVFGKNACYRVEGSIRLDGRQNLTLDGNGATFRSFTRGPITSQGYSIRRHFWFVNCSNIIVRDMAVVGNNTVSDKDPGFGDYDSKYAFEHAFSIDGSSNVLLQNLKVDAVWGDGVYIGGDPKHPSRPSQDITVENVTIDRNGRQGVGMNGAEEVLLDRIRLLHSRRAGFDLEPSSISHDREIEIANSYVNSWLIPFSSAGRGDVSFINIHSNTIDGPTGRWIFVKSGDGTIRHDWRVVGNRLLRPAASPGPTLSFSYVENIAILDNVSPVSPKRSREEVYFSSAHGNLSIVGNDFSGACTAYTAGDNVGPVAASANTLSSCPS